MKKEKIQFSLMQICYWCLFVSVNSYALTFFLDNGISSSFVGIIAATSGLLAFASSFFVGYISDRINDNKKVFIIGNGFLAVLVVLIYSLPKDKVIMLIIYSLYVGIITPLLPVLDAWIIKNYSKDMNAYAPIRAWGSLAYCLFALILGQIIANFGYIILMIFGVSFAFVNIGVAMKIKGNGKEEEYHKVNSIQLFFSNPRRVVLLVIIFISSLANAPIVIMIGPIIKRLGGGTGEQGIAMFLMGILQMPIIMMTPKFSWISPYKRFFAGIFLFLICAGVIGIGETILAVYIGAVFNDIGFSLYMPSMREIASKESTENMKSTALTILDAFGVALAGAIGSLAVGLLMEEYGVRFTMFISSTLALIALTILLKYFLRGGGNRKCQGCLLGNKEV